MSRHLLAIGLALAAVLGYSTGQVLIALPSVPAFTLTVAAYLCSANEGVADIAPLGGRKYTVICKNDAHFLNVTVHDVVGEL